ncbi:MAG: glycerophosphodiester phosphodiesterase, partial [Firmicutes bacterium]|nr:glycerophosphodiester phosphodiesterase [Bacillota bacterium]
MEKRQILDELLKWRYAHRGFHQKPVVPENSMEAFKRAVDEGFGIELDVHLSKDGKLAVIHDASLWRTCGIDLYIEEINLEDAQIYFLEKSEERIPELGAVLEMVDGRVPLLIEIKELSKEKDVAPALAMMLRSYEGPYIVESFNPLSLMRFAK